MSVLLLAVVIGVLFVIYCWRPRPRSPPMIPGSLPIVGHALELLKYRNDLWTYVEYVLNYPSENGGLVQFQLGPHVTYCVSDPEVVGILANTYLDKPYFYKFIVDAIGNGLLTADAAMWKVHRKLLFPAFSQQVLNTFLSEMNIQAQNLVLQLKAVAGNGPVAVHDFMIKYVLRSVCRTSLGLETKDQDKIDKDYAEAIDEVMTIMCKRGLNVALHPTFLYNMTALRSRAHQLIGNVKNIIHPIIQKRRLDLKANNFNNYDDGSGKFKPTLDLLLHLSDEQNVLTDDEIRQHLDTIVYGSYDTTSTAIQNILLALGSYPDVQERVYKEITEVFQDNEELSKHDLTQLIYTEAVIKEVLRLYNVVPWIGRKLDTDVVLPKYTLRAGSTCILSLHGLHRHSSWGPDVMQFKPERWLNPATLPTNPNIYATFGIGKRSCIGKQYTMMSLKTSIAHIIRNFQITADISKMKWNFEIVLKPATPAMVNFTLRN